MARTFEKLIYPAELVGEWEGLKALSVMQWRQYIRKCAAFAIKNGEDVRTLYDDSGNDLSQLMEKWLDGMRDALSKELSTAKRVEAAYEMPSNTSVHKWALGMLAAYEGIPDDGGEANNGN